MASFGILSGVFPGLIAGIVIAPAASALRGEPVEVLLALWYGLTPMLALSALVVVIGGAIAVWWEPIHHRLARHDRAFSFRGDRFYHAALDCLLALARRSTGVLARQPAQLVNALRARRRSTAGPRRVVEHRRCLAELFDEKEMPSF